LTRSSVGSERGRRRRGFRDERQRCSLGRGRKERSGDAPYWSYERNTPISFRSSRRCTRTFSASEQARRVSELPRSGAERRTGRRTVDELDECARSRELEVAERVHRGRDERRGGGEEDERRDGRGKAARLLWVSQRYVGLLLRRDWLLERLAGARIERVMRRLRDEDRGATSARCELVWLVHRESGRT